MANPTATECHIVRVQRVLLDALRVSAVEVDGGWSEREGERGRESGRGKGLVVFDFERERERASERGH
jgi:hypothetical protein